MTEPNRLDLHRRVSMTSRKVFALVSVAALAVLFAFAFGAGKLKKTTVNGTAWFNSLEDAKAEAKKSHKPILLFSMFGKLDEEMPCANARTLRATLFKDPDFKKLVSDEVIPAWE